VWVCVCVRACVCLCDLSLLRFWPLPTRTQTREYTATELMAAYENDQQLKVRATTKPFVANGKRPVVLFILSALSTLPSLPAHTHTHTLSLSLSFLLFISQHYLHIIKGRPAFPVIRDSKGTVLSLPPIINGPCERVRERERGI
jgi:hypothetical protein